MEVINLITEQELKAIKDINRKCYDLHLMPPVKCELNAEIYSIDGKCKKAYKALSKSWVRNYYNWLFTHMAGVNIRVGGSTTYGEGNLALKRITGATASTTGYAITALTYTSGGVKLNSYIGSSGENTRGIVIGTSNNAESFDSYALSALIPHGNGTGQMSYGNQATIDASYDADTKTMTATAIRTMTNNSGGIISVGEVGWCVQLEIGGSVYDFMVARDIFYPVINVAAGDQIRITYSTSLVFPS